MYLEGYLTSTQGSKRLWKEEHPRRGAESSYATPSGSFPPWRVFSLDDYSWNIQDPLIIMEHSLRSNNKPDQEDVHDGCGSNPNYNYQKISLPRDFLSNGLVVLKVNKLERQWSGKLFHIREEFKSGLKGWTDPVFSNCKFYTETSKVISYISSFVIDAFGMHGEWNVPMFKYWRKRYYRVLSVFWVLR